MQRKKTLCCYLHLQIFVLINMEQTHGIKINTKNLIGIGNFLMSNISHVSAVTGEQLFPCRQPLADGRIEGIP